MHTHQTLLSALTALLLTGVATAQGADDCSNAEPISGINNFWFSTVNATTDGPPDCGPGIKDIWFRWTAPASSWYDATTCYTQGFPPREAIAVYDLAPCWNLGWPIACDEAGVNSSCPNGRASARWIATAGNEYLIRIGSNISFEGFSGQFQIRGCAFGSNLDCNGNNIPDDCEVANGSAPDCNGNGIPDSCDIATGVEVDCNGNGVPDACDLAAGVADCDGNGIPDACDIAAGAGDCNGNGVLDACEYTSVLCLDRNPMGGTLLEHNQVQYAFKVSNSAPLEIVAFDIYTASVNGGTLTRAAYIYDDAGGVPSEVPLASTTITVGGTQDFYRATLGSPLAVSGDFWISYRNGANGLWPNPNVGYISDLTAGDSSPTAYTFRPQFSHWIAVAPKRAAWRIHCAGAPGDLNGNGVLDTCEAIGSRYCTASANSSGVPGELSILGSPLLNQNDVTLIARQLPLQTFGFFLTSRAPASINPVAGSQGTLCVSGSVGRYVGPGQIVDSGTIGAVALPIDLAAMPTPTGLVAATTFSTWYFQLWYRDANPAPTSNFTDAVQVTFQ